MLKPDCFNDNNILSLRESSEYLCVSRATIYNWVRQGYLTPISAENTFSREEVVSLKLKIEKGESGRLTGRANKSSSVKFSVPAELLPKKKDRNAVADIVEYIRSNNISVPEAMYILALNLLVRKKIATVTNPRRVFKENKFALTGRPALTEILMTWKQSLTCTCSDNDFDLLLEMNLPDAEDILGIIYQSLSAEGEKCKAGAVYTPSAIISEIADWYGSPSCRVLDPCCGSGGFLLAFAEKTDDPMNLYGIDIDAVAVNIAKINLLIRFNDLDFFPNIYNADSLIDSDNQKIPALPQFDITATNPPWGYHFSSDNGRAYSEIFPEIKSGESFSYFIKKGIDLLKQNGSLIYILPESILNISVHADIRKYILENSSIKQITMLDRAFKKVFTRVIMLELKKNNIGGDAVIRNGESIFKVSSGRFLSNPDCIFDTCVNSEDEAIIKKIYAAEHVTLKDNAEWALGIVTGNNSRFLSDEKIDPDYEPVFTGKNIKPYILTDPDKYIKFEPEIFQQCAPEEKFRSAEKLVYKFISKIPVFAYDNMQHLTLNSANILIPKIPELNIKVVLAFLNSPLFAYLYQKKFASIKILRGHLEKMPFPRLDDNMADKITKLVDMHLSGDNKIREIDEIIFSIYGFSNEEKKQIINGIT